MSFLGPVVVAAPADTPNPWFSWSYVTENSDAILTALRDHAILTVEAVGIATVIAIPFAIIAYWLRPLAGPILAFSGVLYTIPSLALVAFLAPYLGVTGNSTILVALAIYALLLIIDNTLTGLQQVPASVKDAAKGMGYGRLGRLWRVELPLAVPGIITGLRLATVSTVALVTVGVIIGQGGLGQLIINGLQSRSAGFYKAPIGVGTLLCVLLGLTFDLLLAGVGRIATPWARRAR